MPEDSAYCFLFQRFYVECQKSEGGTKREMWGLQTRVEFLFWPSRAEVRERSVSRKNPPSVRKKSPHERQCNMGREPFPLPPAPAPACIQPEGYYEDPQPYDPISINDLGCFAIITGVRKRIEASNSVVYAVITREDTEPVSSSYESYDEEEVTKGKSTAQHQWPSPEASIELMKDARICAFLWRKKWLGQWAKQLCVIREHRLLCYKSSKDQTPLLDISLLGCSVVYKEKQTKRKEHKLKITPLGGEAIVLGLQSKEQAEQWLKVIQDISPKNTAGSDVTDSPTLICTKGEQSERYSVASESGSSTDSHAENLESKDGYLNVLVNTQWRSRWCSVRDRQLWIYNDKSKGKVAQQPLCLEGCMVLPDPSPEHLLMQRRYSEPNTYTDSLPSEPNTCDDIYDDVPSTENEQEEVQEVQNSSEEGTVSGEENGKDRVYLDLIPLRSFLHTSSGREETNETSLPSSTEHPDPPPVAPRVDTDPSPAPSVHVQTQKISFLSQESQKRASPTSLPSQTQTLPQTSTQTPQSPPNSRGRAASTDRFFEKLKFSPAGPGSVEVKLGKNRTEADVRRYTDERDRLEREREEVKNTLATLRKDRREVKEELSSCQDPTQQASLEARLKQMEETCREAERRRVEVELSLMEPKTPAVSSPAPNTPTNTTNNGDSPVNSATALKNRPLNGRKKKQPSGWKQRAQMNFLAKAQRTAKANASGRV
ncbi:Actin filament-associated protein 1-like 2 [Labeo rohita]|uniref:Actin filament-associated protein 1-like 2 n=1 Tax=Labeo rohita TaxID=84645 RepID=A0ABQ8M668_LABRO|nr:Actin filament-associated protein 1-like 2 [Labeo rohita]